jgi:hypothetical protein
LSASTAAFRAARLSARVTGMEFACTEPTESNGASRVSDGALTILLYTGAGLVAVAVILVGALWFANAAKKGNLRFRWWQRRTVREQSGARPGTARAPRQRHESG